MKHIKKKGVTSLMLGKSKDIEPNAGQPAVPVETVKKEDDLTLGDLYLALAELLIQPENLDKILIVELDQPGKPEGKTLVFLED